MIALSNSIHLYARPDTKEKFLEFFTSILGLEAIESSDAVGSPVYSVLLYPSTRRASVQDRLQQIKRKTLQQP